MMTWTTPLRRSLLDSKRQRVPTPELLPFYTREIDLHLHGISLKTGDSSGTDFGEQAPASLDSGGKCKPIIPPFADTSPEAEVRDYRAVPLVLTACPYSSGSTPSFLRISTIGRAK